jgi:hypothetical protein
MIPLWARLKSRIDTVQAEIPAPLMNGADAIDGSGIGIVELDVQIRGVVGVVPGLWIGFRSWAFKSALVSP